MLGLVPWLASILACPAPQDTAEPEPPPSDPELLGPDRGQGSSSACERGPWGPELLSIVPRTDASQPNHASLDVTLSRAARVRAVCVQDSDSEEIHVVSSSDAARSHTLVLYGLLADADWTCRVEATCPRGGASREATFSTGPLPADMVQGTVSRHATLSPEGAYTLFNHKGFCDSEQVHRLVVVDLDGRVRWYWDGVDPSYGVGVVADYLGGGVVFSGGGNAEGAGPRMHDLAGDLLYETPEEWGLVFHHYAEQLPGGDLLSLAEAQDSSGGNTWEGFQVLEHDPETDEVLQTWHSQQAVDAGEGGAWDVGETGTPLNANWVSQDAAGSLYVSLCGAQRIAKVDVDSGDVLWTFGPGEDFALFDARGEALDTDDFPQCQHGAEVLGEDHLLVYDNGRDRVESRVSEYELDPAAGTATRTWTWTEPDFFERPWGDVDALSAERVLVGVGHCDCCSQMSDNVTRILEVDKATSEVVWRYELPADQTVLYQASRIDGCALFANARYCEDLDPGDRSP